MRKTLLKRLVCPYFGTSEFREFAVEVDRSGVVMKYLNHDELEDHDDIKQGVIANLATATAYPITDYILNMMLDEDADPVFYRQSLEIVAKVCPAPMGTVIEKSLERLSRSATTHAGMWDREEMSYYDREVATEQKRREFLQQIRTVPLWHTYVERNRHLMQWAELENGSWVLEIGCGNARTTFWVARPKEVEYEYVGTDISTNRLVLAKMAIPEGHFVQASALRLPFQAQSFLDLSRFRSGPGAHLGGFPFECQGAFPA